MFTTRLDKKRDRIRPVPPAEWATFKKPVKGKEIEVELTLPVTGAFSETTPWNCPKTDAIVDDLAQVIMDRSFFDKKTGSVRNDHTSFMDGLGLLATGEKQYLPKVQEFARAIAKKSEGLDIFESKYRGTWILAYKNLFLTEYYLATGDKEVLPGLTDLSVLIAQGRSAYGTYSHGLSYVKLFGLYGRASVYGAMNQCSITANMSLALAQKAGINRPEIDDAVAIGAQFLRTYVDYGTIPYGNNDAWMDHDDNGRNSQAAVFFDIIGDKRSAEYFSRMTLASYRVRVEGHTGHFFNALWGPLGAARGGPDAAQAFNKKTRWYDTLERRVDGAPTFNGPGRYQKWSTAGTQLLHLCLPRKAIYITGKGGSSLPPFSKSVIEESMANSRFIRLDWDRTIAGQMTMLELLQELSNPNAFVRFRVAQELGERDERVVRIGGREHDLVDVLIGALSSRNRYARYGACWGLKMAGRDSERAVDALVRVIQEEDDFTLRLLANIAISPLYHDHLANTKNALTDEVCKRAIRPLLKLTAGYVTGETVTAENYPEATLHQRFGKTALRMLFGDNLDKAGFQQVERPLIYSAIRSVLANPDKGRGYGGALQALGMLEDEELETFMYEIYQVAQSSLSQGGQRRGTEILARYHIKEAIPIAASLLKEDTHARSTRWPAAMEVLAMFGKAGIEPHAELISERMKQCKGNWGRKYKNAMERYLRIEATMAKVRDKTIPLQSIKTYQEDARVKHGLTAYCLLAEPALEKGVTLTWFQGRIMPTSGRLYRNGKAVGAVDPAKGYYVDYQAPRGKVDYRIDFTLPNGSVVTREATFGGRLEDLRGELGIIDLAQNDGINPGTTMRWEAGDAYRLVFVSSAKIDTRLDDLTPYDKFVTNLAEEAGIGGTWKVLADSAGVSVREHTDTEKGKKNHIPVFLIDGKTLVAENYSALWDGSLAVPISRTETGQVLEEGLVATGAGSWSIGRKPFKGVGMGDLSVEAINQRNGWAWFHCSKRRGDERPVYAISEVLHVKSKK